MPGPAFHFAVDISGQQASDAMVRELAAEVLGHAGYPSEAVTPVVEDLRVAVAKASAAAHNGVRLEFSVAEGRLHVEVSSAAGRLWQISRVLS